MFQHILLPTDGSDIAAAMTAKTLAFARSCGARVTALHVVLDFHTLTYHTDMLADTRQRYEQESAAHARALLDEVCKAAREQGVPCESLVVQAAQPHEAIVRTARDRGCDLICIATHGRHGIKGLLLGSETQKVLAHSEIPVLVLR
ncbi:sulfate transporter [Massilia sp. Root351]|uniref:universal stress protein n=1 Tax=Massilia sp. Root351 TaxID=1736522 RepID=UPI00070BD387|nr:universal stress protein [Massilia sp. Root351]KQV82239.1 sulfate transporter [Massilia sp. Root351]